MDNMDKSDEIFVEINSLDDWSRGKKLFQNHSQLIKSGHTPIDFVSMGIVEGGTKKGNTSLMFLFKNQLNSEFLIANIPLAVMSTLNALANNANAGFKAKPLEKGLN